MWYKQEVDNYKSYSILYDLTVCNKENYTKNTQLSLNSLTHKNMSQQAKREAMRRESNLDTYIQDTFVTTWRPLSSFGMPTTVTTKRRNRSQSREATPMPYNKLFRHESNPHLYR